MRILSSAPLVSGIERFHSMYIHMYYCTWYWPRGERSVCGVRERVEREIVT